MVTVELVYIPFQNAPIHLHFSVEEEATIGEVIELSNLPKQFPEIRDFAVGIFGKLAAHSTVVKNGDRIEIYRPLLIDPKEKRRKRAKNK